MDIILILTDIDRLLIDFDGFVQILDAVQWILMGSCSLDINRFQRISVGEVGGEVESTYLMIALNDIQLL